MEGDEIVQKSAMIWLVLAYLFHTIGELCASPVALSFITKLAPVKYAAFMMGAYFAATGLGNKVAGFVGQLSEGAGEFQVFTGIAIFCTLFGILVLLSFKNHLNDLLMVLKKLMLNNEYTDKFFSKTVIGHPAALFVLFFTEMWERFSYYGMRAILVIFLTGAILGDNPGWGWSSSAALSLLGTYAMFAYLAPLAGGWLGDKKIGYRNAVVIGALLMTLGHASMAVETPTFLYIGISLLVVGTGFF